MKRRNRSHRSLPKKPQAAHSFDPRFLRREVFVATAALVVCLFIAAGVVERVVREIHSPYVAAVIAAVLVDLTNEDRTARALPELTVSPALTAAAQAKADDMATQGYFSHTSPEGHDSWYWFEEAGYDYKYAGENLAVNFSESGDVTDAWMHSPTHRDNIVSPKYAEIGIAVATGMYKGKPVIFAVQMFGTPKAKATVGEYQVSAVAVVEATAPNVLGEATVNEEPIGALAEEDGDATVMVMPEDLPWWAPLVAQPQQTLRYAYYIIGLLILAALFFDMELELHWHHIRHAMKAGIMLATMSMLFVVADWVFFAEPILALGNMLGL